MRQAQEPTPTRKIDTSRWIDRSLWNLAGAALIALFFFRDAFWLAFPLFVAAFFVADILADRFSIVDRLRRRRSTK